MSYICSLDFDTAYKLYQRIQDKQEEQTLWDMWLSLYPSMMKKEIEFVSYDDFKQRIYNKVKPTKPQKSEEEIIAEAEKIKRLDINTCKK